MCLGYGKDISNGQLRVDNLHITDLSVGVLHRKGKPQKHFVRVIAKNLDLCLCIKMSGYTRAKENIKQEKLLTEAWFGNPSFAVTEVWVIKCSEETWAKHHITLQSAAAMKIQLLAALFFLLIVVNEAKVYTKCELGKMLKNEGMDGYYGYRLGNWICMAYYESRYNSRAVGPPNSDKSRDYGIFQINSRWWCSNGQGTTANGCNKPCSSFTDDNIHDDIQCVKRIVRDPNRMNAW
ncbi:UNVERIFIED_CONTAM: hypothetical protein K2H54_046892 [Gekko kuhli]